MYSMQHDPPWVQNPARGSLAPSASIYSNDENEIAPRLINHPDMPEIAPLRLDKKPSYHPSYHAHRGQQVQDLGPQLRQSRLPLFKQVRGLLHRPPPLNTPTRNVKYDEFSGDISDSGKAPHVKPSTYRNPYEGTFEARRELRSTTRHQARPQSGRSLSPVSVLNEQDMEEMMQSPDLAWDNEVSPVDETDQDTDKALQPSKASDTPKIPETPPQQAMKAIRRKPAPGRHSVSPESVRPPSKANESIQSDGPPEVPQSAQTSHFSWTTCAPSIAPTATTSETDHPTSRHSNQLPDEGLPPSRFSWSTVNTQTTAMTAHARPDSPPPSPPPTVPTKYKTPPVQSILSRHRPIQRIDREEWTPPPRKTSLPDPGTSTPTSATSKLTIASQQIGSHGSGKKLPPPPELLTPVSPMSHLETLLREEQDKIHQRKNVEHAIADLTKVEKASPLEVSYAQVKHADRKLKELRTTLAEVQLEEREIGIAISRARRKEGEDEGLWVRRVMG